jgi:DNA-binding transcriptional MerR regulator
MSKQEELDIDVPDKLFFRIGEAAQLVNVEPHVLRYWEGEFKMRPQRSSSGQRMYRRKDIARFLRVKALLHDEGFTIAGARKVLSGGDAMPERTVADSAQVRDALKRFEAIRTQIAQARDRFSKALDA